LTTDSNEGIFIPGSGLAKKFLEKRSANISNRTINLLDKEISLCYFKHREQNKRLRFEHIRT